MTARLATLALLVLAACSGEGPADGSDPKRTPTTPADTPQPHPHPPPHTPPATPPHTQMARERERKL